ncbi:hypothetical protein ABVT39_013577 [Epinephelus coioides]
MDLLNKDSQLPLQAEQQRGELESCKGNGDLLEPWVGDKQTVAPSKDVLPCKQLPLQDKLLLFPLQGALIPVHANHRGEAHTRNFSGHHDE